MSRGEFYRKENLAVGGPFHFSLAEHPVPGYRTSMRIMGIDPGLAHTGYGIIEVKGSDARLLASGDVETSAGEALAQRLQYIYGELSRIIREWSPETIAVESLFFCTNVRTAISVAQARGVALLATAASGVAVHEYSPLEIKLAVAGYGKAPKEQVKKMVRAILGLRELPPTSHAADALAVALCHAYSQRFERVVKQSRG
ncbi:MAG: crossover junction endodeoxyribonuclease RuvC [Candidatus Sumerlaeaceae bacterium]|nr:crossover junction endodeoxyribonuclease RuvC [Candidatus Sumerlaeaceae bacterium]